ncbi:MAG: hypothetical protein LBB58_05030 [Cellulomonadaceae bacterium]|jgi:predicted ribosomally synthesized peptide with SipW-like signal peptide|nr:hypothetical protein [Cellulomonadaceae bacterium]
MSKHLRAVDPAETTTPMVVSTGSTTDLPSAPAVDFVKTNDRPVDAQTGARPPIETPDMPPESMVVSVTDAAREENLLADSAEGQEGAGSGATATGSTTDEHLTRRLSVSKPRRSHRVVSSRPTSAKTATITRPRRDMVIASAVGLALGLGGGVGWALWSDSHASNVGFRAALMTFNVYNAESPSAPTNFNYLKSNPTDVVAHNIVPVAVGPGHLYYKVGIDSLTRGEVGVGYAVTLGPAGMSWDGSTLSPTTATSAEIAAWQAYAATANVVAWWPTNRSDPCDAPPPSGDWVGLIYSGPLSSFASYPLGPKGLIGFQGTHPAYTGPSPADAGHYRTAQDTICLLLTTGNTNEHSNTAIATGIAGGISVTDNDTWTGVFEGFDYYTNPTAVYFRPYYVRG